MRASRTPEYRAWSSMKERCANKRPHVAKYYGDKGITVCDRWLESFANFFEDMGPKPGPDFSLDRKDGSKGYSPDNCRWATVTEQNQNRKTVRNITINGVTKCIAEWAKEGGLAHNTITGRIDAGRPESEWLLPLTDEYKNRKELVYTHDGQTMTLQAWAKHLGISDETLRYRIRNAGWTISRALSTPAKYRRRS